MSEISSICVYCGASSRADAAYLDAAYRLGRLIGDAGRRLIYGGGRLGLMGRVADGALSAGGDVIGIIPEHLYKVEVQHDGVSELLVVDSMHERKAEMVRRAEGFCVLPGGMGTLDELVEVMTWRQLGLHGKPIVLVNQDGYFEPFRSLIGHIVRQGFAGEGVEGYIAYVDRVDDAIGALDGMGESTSETRADKI